MILAALKKLALLFIAIVSAFSLSACQGTVVRPQSQIDPKRPWVVQLGTKTVADYNCETVWACQPVNITASEACDYLVFDFQITDTATGKLLVPNARSYWGAIDSGLHQVEYGYNNPIFKATSFSKPIATCLKSAPNKQVKDSLQAFPDAFCEKGLELGCSANSITAWELEELANEDQGGAGSSGGDGGAGYSVVCEDGWVSESEGIQGACSHHGGIAD